MSNEIVPVENSNNSGIYTDAEFDILEKSKSIRLQMVDAIILENKGAPTHGGTVRVVNEVLTSLDKTVNDAAQGRLKHQDNADKEAILLTVAETLKAVSANRAKGVTASLTIEDEIIDVAVVDGEIAIQPDKLDFDDFVDEQ